MAIKDWTTSYPTSTDSTTEMPDLTNLVDSTRTSHAHSVRDAVISLESFVGDDTLASGTLRRVAADASAIGPITLPAVSAPTPAASRGDVFFGSATGNTELYYQDEGGTSTQVTSSGTINVWSLFERPAVAGGLPVWDGSKFTTGFTDDFDDYNLHSRWEEPFSPGPGSSYAETDVLTLTYAGDATGDPPTLWADLAGFSYITLVAHVTVASAVSNTGIEFLLEEAESTNYRGGFHLSYYYYSGSWRCMVRTFANGTEIQRADTVVGSGALWMQMRVVAGYYASGAYSTNAHTDYPTAADWIPMGSQAVTQAYASGRMYTPNKVRINSHAWSSASPNSTDIRHFKVYYG